MAYREQTKLVVARVRGLKECKVCGYHFAPQRGAVYCSDACKMKAWRDK